MLSLTAGTSSAPDNITIGLSVAGATLALLLIAAIIIIIIVIGRHKKSIATTEPTDNQMEANACYNTISKPNDIEMDTNVICASPNEAYGSRGRAIVSSSTQHCTVEHTGDVRISDNEANGARIGVPNYLQISDFFSALPEPNLAHNTDTNTEDIVYEQID